MKKIVSLQSGAVLEFIVQSHGSTLQLSDHRPAQFPGRSDRSWMIACSGYFIGRACRRSRSENRQSLLTRHRGSRLRSDKRHSLKSRAEGNYRACLSDRKTRFCVAILIIQLGTATPLFLV